MKDYEKDDAVQNGSNGIGIGEKPTPLTLTIDVDAYEEYFADSSLSKAEKHELLLALWEIIVGFVDLGFNIHPVQQALEHKDDASLKMAEHQSPMLQSTIHSPIHCEPRES